jgi:hypothetical protein
MDTNTKYTRDQKRRAVQEIVKRLAEFDSALKLIRQFDITEEDIVTMTADRYVNGTKYTIGHDPYTYDAHPRQFIDGWPHVEQRVKSLSGSTFDQAVEEATELRTRAIEAARDREEMLKEAHKASVARYMKSAGLVPHPSLLKSYTDWVTLEELEARTNQAALTQTLQDMTLGPHPNLKSYTDWS